MTDFRALLAIVAERLDSATDPDELGIHAARLVKQIRAALAQPEAEGPSDEELDIVVVAIQALIPCQSGTTTHNLDAIDRGREILKKCIARWGRPAPLPLPQEGQADG